GPRRQDLDRLGLAPARAIARAARDRRRAARPPATRRTPEGKTGRARRPPLERTLLDRPLRARLRHFEWRARGARGPGRAPRSLRRGRFRRGPGAAPLGAAAARQGSARLSGDAVE